MNESNTGSSMNRRTFIMGAAGLASATAASARVKPRYSANDKVNLVVVGAGGRGADDINDLKDTGVNIVALCDADHRRAADMFAAYHNAKRYSDWRKMFDAEKS